MPDDARLQAFVREATAPWRGESPLQEPLDASQGMAAGPAYIAGAPSAESVPAREVVPSEPADGAADEGGNDVDAAAARDAWFVSLDELTQAAATADRELARASYSAWLDEQTDPETGAALLRHWDRGELDSVADEPEEAPVLSAGKVFPLVQLANDMLADPAAYGLADEEAARTWLAWSVTTSAAEWEAACLSTGWDPADRPGHGDVNELIEVRILSDNLRQHAEDIREGRRRPL